MVVVLAAALFLAAIPLQMLGYTGTCTQGASGPFVTGTVLSAPLLAASLLLLISTSRRYRREPAAEGRPLACIGAVGLAALAIWTLIANLGVARATLILGTTPCGTEYGFYAEPYELAHVLVGIAYGIGPAAVAAAATVVAWLALPTRVHRQPG